MGNCFLWKNSRLICIIKVNKAKKWKVEIVLKLFLPFIYYPKINKFLMNNEWLIRKMNDTEGGGKDENQ